MSAIKPQVEEFLLYQDDFESRIQHLQAEAEAAREAEDGLPRMLGEVSLYEQKRAEHAALIEEAKADAVKVKVRSVSRITYRDLKLKHPPRTEGVPKKTIESDANLGYNEDTFFDELAQISLVTPTFESDVERKRFLEDLSAIQFERIKLVVYGLNEVGGADPKPLPALRPTPPSDET